MESGNILHNLHTGEGEEKKDDNYCTYVGEVFQVLFSCSTFPW